MKKIFANILAFFAKSVIRKYRPKVVGITGSVGKTSTREAVFAVMAAKFRTRRGMKNYNNEFGLPLSIIGSESPGKNPFAWLVLFVKCIWMLFVYVDYPEVLVLEMGIDRPGDMDKLVNIVTPDIGVLTGVGISHLEFFASELHVLQEKTKIFKGFGERNIAVLNIDDKNAKSVIPLLKSPILTYGINPAADIKILDYKISYSKNRYSFGVMSHLSYKNETVPVYLDGVIGLPHVHASAAAAAVGIATGLSLSDISRALEKYKAQPGRLAIVPGIRNSIIIDDTYNSAPQSAEVALRELADFPAGNKIAVMGDMLELGYLSDESHKRIGHTAIKYSLDYFIGVGPKMKLAVDELRRLGFKADHVFYFENSTDAIAKVKNIILERSAILVKGSQGVRMEKIVKAIMADPGSAGNLLVRQYGKWLKN